MQSLNNTFREDRSQVVLLTLQHENFDLPRKTLNPGNGVVYCAVIKARNANPVIITQVLI